MAMCWIEKIHNFHPTRKLFFRIDDARQPTFKDTITSQDSWYQVDPGKAIKAENFGVPWSGSDHALWVAVGTSHEDRKILVQFDIVGQDAWDYIRLRDSEYRERGRVEVGSMGAAAGTNFSGWRLIQHTNGDVNLHCDWRQGLTKRGAESLGQAMFKIGQLAVEVIGAGLAALATVAAAAIDAGGEKTGETASAGGELLEDGAPGGGGGASAGGGSAGGGSGGAAASGAVDGAVAAALGGGGV